MTALTPDWLAWPEIKAVAAAFPPGTLRFVGGAVRDALRGRAVTEVDAATTLRPDACMAALEQAGIRAVPTGMAHGTVTALVGGKAFEITTLRRDVACDGRHAEVEYTDSWREDALRRDFTMNALYLSPEGQLFDYIGGEEDARAGYVRFIGDPELRIEEDGLRILRYFRFLAQMGGASFDATRDGPIFPPDMHVPSFEACAELAYLVDDISGERIHNEMFKLLALPDLTDDPFMWMSEAGVGEYIFPEYVNCYAEDLIPLEKEFGLAPDPMRRLCACLSDDEAAPLSTQYGILRNRWKLSNEEGRRLSMFHQYCYALAPDAPLAVIKKIKRSVGETIAVDLALITWAAHAASGYGKEQSRAAFAPMLEVAMHWPAPAFPVSGADLIALGFAPGKALGKKLKELERLWEESDYTLTREALLKAAKDD